MSVGAGVRVLGKLAWLGISSGTCTAVGLAWDCLRQRQGGSSAATCAVVSWVCVQACADAGRVVLWKAVSCFHRPRPLLDLIKATWSGHPSQLARQAPLVHYRGTHAFVSTTHDLLPTPHLSRAPGLPCKSPTISIDRPWLSPLIARSRPRVPPARTGLLLACLCAQGAGWGGASAIWARRRSPHDNRPHDAAAAAWRRRARGNLHPRNYE